MGRFFRRGTSKIMFVPAIANRAAPTRIELDAGTDLSEQIAEINGFELTNSPITTPNLADRFTPQVEGEDTAPDSSLVLYDLDDNTTNRTTLAKGVTGYIVLLPYGDVSGKRCETWDVKSLGVNDSWTTGNEAARYTVPFSFSTPPEQDAAVPA